MYKRVIDLSKLYKNILSNKKIILISTSITTFMAVIYCIFATPIFTSSIMINPPKLSDAGNGIGGVLGSISSLNLSGSGGLLSQKTDSDISIALLTTKSVLDMQIHQFNLIKYYGQKDIEGARLALLGATKFIPDLKSGFLSINVADKNPKLATQIANNYIVCLGNLISKIAIGKTSIRKNFLEAQVESAQFNLTDAENKVKIFAQQNGILAGNQSQVIAGIVTQLQAQLIALQSKLKVMSQYETPSNPEYMQVEKQIFVIKQQLDGLNIGQENNQDKITIPAGLAPELAQQYVILIRNYLIKEEIYKQVIKQFEISNIDRLSELNPTSIQVIDYAQVPLHKTSPKRLKIILLAVIIGFILGILVIIWKTRNDIVVYEN